MSAIFSIFSCRATVVCLAAAVLGVSTARAAAAGPSPVDQMAADLRSKDPAKIANAEAKLKAAVSNWQRDWVVWPLFDVMDELGMAKDVDAMCLDAIVLHPTSLNLDQLLTARINALLKEGQKDEALAVSKSLYDAASLEGTANAIRMVTRCLAVDTPPGENLASRFKRQQIAWASAGGATTQPTAAAPATQASTSGGEDLGEPVLATIKVDAMPFEAAIKKLKPVSFDEFVTKGNLLLLTDGPAEARGAFEQAENLAANDDQHMQAVTGIARAIRAQSGCVGPANAYILSLRDQK